MRKNMDGNKKAKTDSGSKFEEELKIYFPELYDIYRLTKTDRRAWIAIRGMAEMWTKKRYGKITITYQEGKINVVDKTIRERD